MTEKELRTAYDQMSLSEERMSELSRRFAASVKTASPDKAAEIDPEAFMNFDHEYRSEPKKKKPLRTAIISTAAAAAVVAVGLTAAFKGGLIPVQQPQTESTPHTSNGIALPQYQNKDIILGSVSVNNDFSECAELDSNNGNIYRTQLVAEFTVNEVLGAIDDTYTMYEVSVDECFFNLTGLEQLGRTINFVARGTESSQSEGFPVYSTGDRILAALWCTDGEYRTSAEFATADVLTIDGKDYAAVRSSVLAGLPIEDYSGGEVIEYPTTTNVNPAKYYGLYDVAELADCLIEKVNAAQKIKQPVSGTFRISGLDFRADKEAMDIYDSHFSGNWSQYSADEKDFLSTECLTYFCNCGLFELTPGGTVCGGFAEDDNAYYMLRGESVSDYNSLWVIMKNDSEKMYVYSYSDDDIRSFTEYSYHYWLTQRFDETLGQNTISRIGIMKYLAEADDPALSEAVYGLFENAEADFAGIHWKRVPLSRDTFGENRIFGLDFEDNNLDISEPEHPVIYVDLYDSTMPWKDLDIGEEYQGVIKRTFIAEFSKSGEKWTYTLRPQSGVGSDIEDFWSPYEHESGMYSADSHDICTGLSGYDSSLSETTVEYKQIESSGIYVVRRVENPVRNDAELYWWEQQTDEYRLLIHAEHMTLRELDDSLLVLANTDGAQVICEFIENSVVNEMNLDITFNDPDVYFRGDYMIVKRNDSSDGISWYVTDKDLWEYVEIYPDSEFTLTEDGFIMNRNGRNIVYNSASDDIESVLLSSECHARSLWSLFEMNSPLGSGDSFEVEVNGVNYFVSQISNPEWRTRQGILKEFEKVYTREAAEKALQEVTGSSVVEYNGAMYTTSGARGGDLNIFRVTPEVTWENPEKTQAEITYTIEYLNEDFSGVSEETDTYTINAYKEADGWKLDRFYYPY